MERHPKSIIGTKIAGRQPNPSFLRRQSLPRAPTRGIQRGGAGGCSTQLGRRETKRGRPGIPAPGAVPIHPRPCLRSWLLRLADQSMSQGLITLIPHPSKPSSSLVATPALLERAMAAIWQSAWLMGCPEERREAAIDGVGACGIPVEGQDPPRKVLPEHPLDLGEQSLPASTCR